MSNRFVGKSVLAFFTARTYGNNTMMSLFQKLEYDTLQKKANNSR
ncbi:MULTISPECIES: hypothetical protein [Leptospira]|uniref:Uncharacterized protein n=3 Tax=Leptospira weilii TaxID=28184 RepID=A0A828YZT2_9LEPT|nr:MULTISPECIES: hypothetical protein [Leptospira]EKR64148.1 hypothetical protein LEP1GSC036_3773 [Leptospira weilii str. 2006001853]EMY12760.1 hypothetical protein LEP1GSC043_1199 [Leptospira weilii str. Ecochallenge]EMJ61230.1 hypothetical protein LEP1GSC051_3344 [Leptospira sp. P2653]EMN45678.1 hypothetical protein LEP1GSC086_2342 [Leptospira weilii str. LNT 1234]EMN91894.1 hypothetical protein LEP1GSC108_1686 [Leptospira weilii str. UI 13098]